MNFRLCTRREEEQIIFYNYLSGHRKQHTYSREDGTFRHRHYWPVKSDSLDTGGVVAKITTQTTMNDLRLRWSSGDHSGTLELFTDENDCFSGWITLNSWKLIWKYLKLDTKPIRYSDMVYPQTLRWWFLLIVWMLDFYFLSSTREARAFHKLRRYYTRPLRLDWGPKNGRFYGLRGGLQWYFCPRREAPRTEISL